MILKNPGEVLHTQGKDFFIGGLVWANAESDWSNLFGRVVEIHTDGDMETENEGPDIYCDFELPEDERLLAHVKQCFSALYGRKMQAEELPLDQVIMGAADLEPVSDGTPTQEGQLFALTSLYDGTDGEYFNTLAVSSDRSMLMRVMHDDLDSYDVPAVLSHSRETEDGCIFTFEGDDTVTSDFYIEYKLYRVPVYSKGGAAA